MLAVHERRVSLWRRGTLAAVIAGAMTLAGGVGAAAPGPVEPNPVKTPEEAKAAVAQIAVANNKREKVNQLRRSCPPALLAEALVNVIASDPAFAQGAAPKFSNPTRTAAYEGLSSTGAPGPDGAILVSDRQVDQLVLGLKEPDEQIRRMCAGALGRVPEARRASVVGVLAGVLDDASFPVVQQALLSLARLKLSQDVPEGVRTIAFTPTEAMRAKWNAAAPGAAGVGGVGVGAQELAIRETAMNVVLAWQGAGPLLEHDLSKDETGRAARAISVGRKILKDNGRADLDTRQHLQVIAELRELLQQPGEPRDVDRGAAMALSTLARKAPTDPLKSAARHALKQASETAPASKQGVIGQAMAGLK